MLLNRILLMRPALYAPVAPQIRAFSLARIALLPAGRAALPPPPPPAKGNKTGTTAKATIAVKKPALATTKKPALTATKQPASKATKQPAAKATKKAVSVAPTTTRVRLIDQQRAAKERAKENEKLAREREKAKEKAKLAKEKEREKEKEKLAKEKEKEKEKLAKEKEKLAKEKLKMRLAKKREQEKEKRLKAKMRERERARKVREKLREAAKKVTAKRKAEMVKALKKPYPPPPKRPLTAYFMFTADPNVKRDKGQGIVEDAILASRAWKALSEAEREVYSKKAELARTAWKEAVAKWVSTLNLAQLDAARANHEPGTRDDTALDALPIRPGNKYAMFLAELTKRQDFRDKIDALAQKAAGDGNAIVSRKKIGLYGRTTADLWKAMSEKEKAVYATKAAEAKAQWEKKFGHIIEAQKDKLVAPL